MYQVNLSSNEDEIFYEKTQLFHVKRDVTKIQSGHVSIVYLNEESIREIMKMKDEFKYKVNKEDEFFVYMTIKDSELVFKQF